VPDFVKLAATAKRLIEQSGRAVTLYKQNREPADEAQPWRGPDMSVPPSSAEGGGRLSGVKAAFVPARGSGFGRDYVERQDDLSRNVEQVALIAATSLPAGTDLGAFDSMLDGSTVWRIYFAAKLAPATTALCWELGVGR
jgi:hypothetical protein